MSNIRGVIIAEGQTEQTFCREILAPYLGLRGVFFDVVIAGKTGGDIRFARVRNDIKNVLKSPKSNFVTTMFDFYGIGTDWPGWDNIRSNMVASQKAETLENATFERFVNDLPECRVDTRFIPYIAVYEFEAMLFSDIAVLSESLGVDYSIVESDISGFTPEEINNSSETAPSKRIQRYKSSYRKVAMGKTIAEKIGIEKIRAECPHFNDWLRRLESLGNYC